MGRFIKFLLFIIPLMNPDTIYSQHKNSYENERLNGKPKEILEENHRVKIVSGKILPGNKIDSIGKRNYLKKYDIKGNWIQTNSYGLKNNLKIFLVREYDSLGNCSKTLMYNPDSILLRWNCGKFDDNGNSIEAIDYKSDSSLISKIFWKYENDKLVETLEYSTIYLIKKATYNYDKNGNEIITNIYNSMDSLEGVFEYEYDSIGNKIIEKLYSKSKLIEQKLFDYDEKGNITEELIYNPGNNLTSKTTYTYDYDQQDNWIKRIESKENTPKFITTRKIIYFE